MAAIGDVCLDFDPRYAPKMHCTAKISGEFKYCLLDY